MGLIAAIAYLRFLRQQQDISQSHVARAAGVESKQVYRWEKGESEPSALGLAAFIAVVNGHPDDVQQLLIGNNTKEDGHALAELTLKGLHSSLSTDVNLTYRAISLINQLTVEDVEAWLDYGSRLLQQSSSDKHIL